MICISKPRICTTEKRYPKFCTPEPRIFTTVKFSPQTSTANLHQLVLRFAVLYFRQFNNSLGSLRPGTFEMHPNSSKNSIISCLIVNPCDTINMLGSFSSKEAILQDFNTSNSVQTYVELILAS